MKEFLALASTLLVPPLVSWLKNCGWPAWKQAGLALLVSLVLGALSVVVDDQIDWTNLAGTAGFIFTAATMLYLKWFKATEANKALEEKQVL